MDLGPSLWRQDPTQHIAILPTHGLSEDEGNGSCPGPQILGKAEIMG